MKTKAGRRAVANNKSDGWAQDVPAAAKPSPGRGDVPSLTMASGAFSKLRASAVKLTQRLAMANASPKWWAIFACTILLCSAGVRQWRDWQFTGIARERPICPFPLEELPRTFGPWSSNPAEDGKLADEITRIAGSSDHIIRAYQNESTGDVASTLVLYGLAGSVFAHTPDVCYAPPAFNRLWRECAQDLEIMVPGWTAPVRYRSLYFSKSFGGVVTHVEVIYTFLHNGEWLPEVASRWKMFRLHPGMFKIQLQREVAAIDRESSPLPDLLKDLVQSINTRYAEVKSRDKQAK